MGIQINGNTNNINAGIGSLSIEDINELDIVGVVTAANFKTGTTNVHSAGIEIAGINVLGANTPIGVGATIFNSGGAIFAGTSGVVTATAFHGSGANLTGIDTDLVSDTSPQLGGDLQSNGSDILIADNDYLKIGTGNDLTFRHDAAGGNHSFIMHSGAGDFKIGSDTTFYLGKTGPETFIKAIPDGAVELYHNNLKKFETTADGIKLGDAVKLSFNDYSYIWDNNTNNNTYWMNASNSTFIDVATTGKHIGLTAKGTAEAMVNCYADGAVELYHNNTKRLETTSAGVKVTGHLSFNSSSQGIDFSASAHSSGMQNEVLDDYERGSWTPSFWNAATGGTQLTNPSNTQASYVKVGRIVYLHLGVHGLTKNWAGSNTQVFVRGIPYRSYFQHNGHCVRGGFWGANDDDMNIYANLRQYDYYMEFQKGGGAQGRYDALYWSDMHWEGYGNLTCEMTYETDQGV